MLTTKQQELIESLGKQFAKHNETVTSTGDALLEQFQALIEKDEQELRELTEIDRVYRPAIRIIVEDYAEKLRPLASHLNAKVDVTVPTDNERSIYTIKFEIRTEGGLSGLRFRYSIEVYFPARCLKVENRKRYFVHTTEHEFCRLGKSWRDVEKHLLSELLNSKREGQI